MIVLPPSPFLDEFVQSDYLRLGIHSSTPGSLLAAE